MTATIFQFPSKVAAPIKSGELQEYMEWLNDLAKSLDWADQDTKSCMWYAEDNDMLFKMKCGVEQMQIAVSHMQKKAQTKLKLMEIQEGRK